MTSQSFIIRYGEDKARVIETVLRYAQSAKQEHGMQPNDVIKSALVGQEVGDDASRVRAAEKIVADLERWGFRIIRYRVVDEPAAD